MRKTLHHYFCTLVFIQFFALAFLPATEANIFGDNDRIQVSRADKPLNRIGKLISPTKLLCTASLVGTDLIVTAGHCVAGASSKFISGKYSFELPDGEKVDAKPIASGIENKQNIPREKDWALLRLSRSLGSKHGFFGNHAGEDLKKDLGAPLSLAGYGAVMHGSVLSKQTSCSVRKIRIPNTLLFHDCDAAPGDSGAPIYRCDHVACYLVALHVSAFRNTDAAQTFFTYHDSYANIAVSAESFGAEIAKARSARP